MKRIILALVMMIMAATTCSAETAKDAVRALMKLQARCEAGISYRDFAPAIGDAKFDVNMYLQSKEAESNPELTASINKVMGHYMAANSIWSVKFEYTPVRDFAPAKGSAVDRFLSQYPELNRDVDDGGILERIMFIKSIHIGSAVTHAFAEASKELKIATALLTKQQPLPLDK